MNLQNTKKQYFFTDTNELNHIKRSAEIGFIKKDYFWEFDNVDYLLSSNTKYNEDDWKFLGEVAQKIVELKKELNKK